MIFRFDTLFGCFVSKAERALFFICFNHCSFQDLIPDNSGYDHGRFNFRFR